MFMVSSMKAAIHLGPNYLANLEVYKNTNFEEIQSLFDITQKLILEHSEEILNVNTIDSASRSWRDRYCFTIKWFSDKAKVCSDSVLCLVKLWMEAKVQLKDGKVKWKNSKCLLLTKNCWESMEKQLNSPDFRHCRHIRKIQYDVRERNIEPEKFTDRIVFMPFNDIDWTKKGNDGICSNSQKVKDYARRFLQGHFSFPGLGVEKKWYGTLPYTEGKDTGHPVFKSISALSRGILEKKNGQDTTHFNGGCFEHRALILNYSFCKSAQYLRSSYELVWTVRLDRGRKGTSEAERIRDQRCFWHVWNHKK